MGAKNFFKKAFPYLDMAARTFGGPAGAIGANILGAAIGADVKPEDIEKHMQNLTLSDEGRLKLANAENELQVTMQKLGFENIEALEKIAADDRDSARKREMVVKDNMPIILGVGVSIMFFAVIILLVFRELPPTGRDTLLLLIGALGAGWQAVVGYYFGSSAGSAAKQNTIDKLAA